MVKEIARKIKIPEGVSTSLSQDVLTARGPKGTVERQFWFPGIKIEVKEREVLVDAKSVRIEHPRKCSMPDLYSHSKARYSFFPLLFRSSIFQSGFIRTQHK